MRRLFWVVITLDSLPAQNQVFEPRSSFEGLGYPRAARHPGNRPNNLPDRRLLQASTCFRANIGTRWRKQIRPELSLRNQPSNAVGLERLVRRARARPRRDKKEVPP